MTRRREPLAFLGRLDVADWRRAFILAEILQPPLARRAPPRHHVLGRLDPRATRARP